MVIRTPFIDKYFFITYERSTSKRSMLFSTQKNTFTSLNFKTLSLTIAIVNGSRHESQHNKFTNKESRRLDALRSSKRNGVSRIRKD